MDRRCSERIKTGYKTEIFYGNKTHSGTVENISAAGVNVLTDELDPGVEFRPDEPIEIKFLSPAGDTIILKCMIMWSSRIPPHNVRHRIGMEINKPFRDRVDIL